MRAEEFIKLLNCTARFINYGKHNVLAIFEWEQAHLFKQTGKQAALLKSYKRWNEVENRIVSGKGVELDIDGCEDKTRFFDISQTSEPKFDQKAKQETDSAITEECADITDIGFPHKHRGLLLTALWMELSSFQNEYESFLGGNAETLLCHISVIYIIHSRFKSNWQNEGDVETAFGAFVSEYSSTSENPALSRQRLSGALFSKIFQAAVNLLVKIENRFAELKNISDSDAAENYYMRSRFYDICGKEKVAVCRLRPSVKISSNLSIDDFEIVETLPYKSGMEREAFLEYLQSVFNNSLTLTHLVLVRRKNISGVTVVAAYRVEVTDWNPKQEYINFEIVSSYCAKCYYLRLVASEVLDSGGGIEPDAGAIHQNRTKTEIPPQTEEAAENTVSEPLENADVHSAAVVHAAKDAVNGEVKRKRKKERTDVLEKVSRLKEDIQNKTC